MRRPTRAAVNVVRLISSAAGGRRNGLAVLAEFIRELIVSGTREVLAAARGRVGGRPTVVIPQIIRAVHDCCSTPTPASSPSPGCLYNHIPDLRERHAAGRVPLPAARAATS